MENAGLFMLHGGAFLRECEWLRRRMAQALPGLAAPGAVAVETQPQLLEALKAQIKRYDLFVVAAEPRQFHSLKAQLLEALGIPVGVNAEAAALQKKHPEDTLFPDGAVLFFTPEARYNGFAMRCGRQHMLVLPLALDLLEPLEEKLTLYLRSAAGGQAVPMRPNERSVDEMLAQMSACEYSAPLTPDAIVPMAASRSGQFMARRANEMLTRLAGRGVSCDLLLPPGWAGISSFIRSNGGNSQIINPVFLQERSMEGSDASEMISRRMRAAGCAFCGIMVPPAQDSAYATVAVAGPGEYAKVRRVSLGGGNDIPELTASLLAMLCEYRGAQQTRTVRGRARRAVAAGLAAMIAAGLFIGARSSIPGTQAQEQGVSNVPLRVNDAVKLESGLLSGVIIEESESAVAPALENGAQAVQEMAGAQLAEEVSAMAQALDDSILSINPFNESDWSFLQMLKDFFEWLLNLLRGIPITIEETTTKAPTSSQTTVSSATSSETSSSVTSAKPAVSGIFDFLVLGFGHGVGLSQEGTKALASQGKTYQEIIKHYYYDSNIAISNDTGKPSTVIHGGVSIELKEYLARVAYAEIGRCGLVADEAIKAQMVCAYTIAKKQSFKTTDSNQKLLSSADWNGSFAKQFHTKMLSLASDVLGKYITYKGATAEALYFASCGGRTASAKYAWGGNEPAAYLTGGRTSPETVSRSSPSFTTDQIKSFVTAYNAKYPAKAITLGADASQWLKILRVDANGYVEQLQIGDRTLTGGEARLYFFGPTNLRSHNFTMSFQAN